MAGYYGIGLKVGPSGQRIREEVEYSERYGKDWAVVRDELHSALLVSAAQCPELHKKRVRHQWMG